MSSGNTFDNSLKETEETLEWFRNNLYEKDGVLYWGKSVGTSRRRSSAYLHKPAGTVSKRGYLQIRQGKDKFMAHRILWALHNGRWPKTGIDHINGDTLDNSIGNMREENQYVNSNNARKYPRLEPWIATGVSRYRGRFVARAQVNNEQIHIGVYSCHTAAMISRLLFDVDNGFSERHGKDYNKLHHSKDLEPILREV